MVTEGRNAGNYGYGDAVAVVLFLISRAIVRKELFTAV
jgi:hypothetical protein